MDDTRELAEKLLEYSKNSLYISYSEFCCEVHILAKAHLDLLAKWEALDEPTDIMVVEGAKQINKPLQLSVQRARNSFKAMIAKLKEE